MKSYVKIFPVGSRHAEKLFDGPVEITEKVDGSQFGFGKFDGNLVTRSKGRIFDYPDKMFELAYEQAKRVEDSIPEGWSFYGEYLQKPKHNTLEYKEVPKNNIALYAICDEKEEWLSYSVMAQYADAMQFDVVPLLHYGPFNQIACIDIVKNTPSRYGKVMIEGIVVKNYHQNYMFSGSGQIFNVLCGKYVSEAFKEIHNETWADSHKNSNKFDAFKDSFRTEARWLKAMQHLKENGSLLHEPKDIGPLIKEIYKDIKEECEDDIKQFLYNLYIEEITKRAVYGFPEWYKEWLVKDV